MHILPTRLGGAGPDTLLLHGYGADRQTWLGIAPGLFNVATVWATDLPGHGETWQTHPAGSLEQMAEQIAPMVWGISDKPIHLVGHSLGATLLLFCAAMRPERVASISLLAPAGLGQGVNADFILGYPQLTHAAPTIALLRSAVHDPKLIGEQIAPFVLAHLAKKGATSALRTCAQALLANNPGLQQAINTIVSTGVPRQVIWGRQDTINPPVAEDQARFGGRWQWVDNCGHLPHIEHRVKVTQHLSDFIGYNSEH